MQNTPHKYITFFYYGVKLTHEEFLNLKKMLRVRFGFLIDAPHYQSVTYNSDKKELKFELSPMGRSYWEDASCEARPNTKGREITVDSIRWEQVSCFMAGYFCARDSALAKQESPLSKQMGEILNDISRGKESYE